MMVKIAAVSPKSYSAPGTNEERKNVEVAKKYIDIAAKDGVKIVCLPEGYPGPFCGPPTYSGVDELCEKAKGRNLVDGICRACSQKVGTFQAAEDQGLRLLDGMSGHPSIAEYWDLGYEVIVF